MQTGFFIRSTFVTLTIRAYFKVIHIMLGNYKSKALEIFNSERIHSLSISGEGRQYEHVIPVQSLQKHIFQNVVTVTMQHLLGQHQWCLLHLFCIF